MATSRPRRIADGTLARPNFPVPIASRSSTIALVPFPMDLSSLPANDLARRCSDANSADAWNEFIQRFQRPIALVVLKVCRDWGAPSPQLVEDLVQETFLRLCADQCRLLRNFNPHDEDSIIGYLKVIARNVTHDHFRASKSQKSGGLLRRFQNEEGTLDFLIDSPGRPNPAESSIRLQEIDRALQAHMPDPITDRDRTIFWLYYRQGYSAREIAAIGTFGLSVKGVEASIHRTTRLLREVMAA
jgi:RNA polymerase sigma-70 factor (ECF subfamily)